MFVSARQHVLISDSSQVRKNYFKFYIIQNETARILRPCPWGGNLHKYVYIRPHQGEKVALQDVNNMMLSASKLAIS